MEEDNKNFKCEHCDYKSKWKCNIKRHVVRNHTVQKGMDDVQKGMDDVQKCMDVVQKGMDDVQKGMDDVLNKNQCVKCNKIFSRKIRMINHQEKCKGLIDPLQCEYCLKVFTFKNNKYAHIKICKLKSNTEQLEDTSHIQSITNNIDNSTNTTTNTNNNINNTTNNTLNNNNTINIITYNPVYTELMPIVPKHIEKIKRLIKHSNTTNSKEIMRIIRQFADYSLDVYQNRYVIKNNLRSSYSKVHCGNNNWKHFVDSTILPQFTNSIVGSFQELIQGSCDINKHKFMDGYIDEMYSHGDLKYDTPACKDYAVLLEELKLKLYDLTKDMKQFHSDFNTEELI